MATAPSFIIWLWEWKIPFNMLLHGSCKGKKQDAQRRAWGKNISWLSVVEVCTHKVLLEHHIL